MFVVSYSDTRYHGSSVFRYSDDHYSDARYHGSSVFRYSSDDPYSDPQFAIEHIQLQTSAWVHKLGRHPRIGKRNSHIVYMQFKQIDNTKSYDA